MTSTLVSGIKSIDELQSTCKRIRLSILEMVFRAQCSHIGSALSVVEALVALYFRVMNIDPHKPEDPSRDKLVFSKAHASSALYAVLAERGFFAKDLLDRYYIDGGILPGHLDCTCAPGIESSGGSLGHGLGIAVGFALANKLDRNPARTFAVLSDGECNEGSVWEGVMLAAHHKLDQLTMLIDFNFIQSFGRTNEILDQSNLEQRLCCFGWSCLTVDGHNLSQLIDALSPRGTDKPHCVVMNTVKGKGISFMENKLLWHYRSPRPDEYAAARRELA